MTLRFKCLLIDHDDTSVDSTVNIHRPCYVEFMDKYKPDHPLISLHQWFRYLWDIGLVGYYKNIVGLTEEERHFESEFWQDYVASHPPPNFFDGFLEMLQEFRRRGGIIGVVSFSDKENITRHYNLKTNSSFLPDEIFGLDKNNPEHCKPYAYPIHQIIEKYGFQPEDIVMVDDMKQGFEMANKVNGGSCRIKKKDMESICDKVCSSVEELRNYILIDKEE
ncbi:Phosphoglycolate phosphatase [Entamoeba marina]